MIFIEGLFWLVLLGIFYTYAGYPLLLMIVGLFRSRPSCQLTAAPMISVIITVHNEEKQIAEKLENTLAMKYPRDRVEWIVASDGSTDSTVRIAGQFADRGVRIIDTGTRSGKEAAQKAALKIAQGEIIVFSDAGTRADEDTLEALVTPFANPEVGCVSSVDRHSHHSPAGGEGAYIRYEMFLRDWESRAGSLVGLSGSLFAVRKEVCDRWSDDMPSDFYLILTAVRAGYRGISQPLARGYYSPVHDEEKEFRRKSRTILRGMTVFFNSLDLINPLRYGFFSLELISHKLFRWLVPFFLLSVFTLNVALAMSSHFFAILFGGQLMFYLAALIGWKPGLKGLIFRLPFWFCLFNLSILYAWWQFTSGQRIVLWEPTKR